MNKEEIIIEIETKIMVFREDEKKLVSVGDYIAAIKCQAKAEELENLLWAINHY